MRYAVRAAIVKKQKDYLDALEQWLRTSQTKPSLVYCIPTHHNPTSVSLTAQRHHQLVAMAMQYGFVIVYDDPYRFLQE